MWELWGRVIEILAFPLARSTSVCVKNYLQQVGCIFETVLLALRFSYMAYNIFESLEKVLYI